MACSTCGSNSCAVNGEDILYTGTGISGLSYPADPTIDQMIYALGAKVILNTNSIASQSIIQVTRVVISAELNALPSTPIVIIPGVTGRYIVPINMTWRYTHGGTSFTNSSGALLRYTGTAISLSTVANTFAASANHMSVFGVSTFTNADPSTIFGIGVELGTAGTFTTGNGSITITIAYYLI